MSGAISTLIEELTKSGSVTAAMVILAVCAAAWTAKYMMARATEANDFNRKLLTASLDQARSALAQMLAAEVERSDKFIKEMDRHRSVVTSIAAAQAENQRESSNDRERLAKAIDRLAEEQAHLRRSIDSLEGDVETCIHEIRRYQTD